MMKLIVLLVWTFAPTLYAETCLDIYKKDPEKYQKEIQLSEEIERFQGKDILQVMREILKDSGTQRLATMKGFYSNYLKAYRASDEVFKKEPPFEPKEAFLTLITHYRQGYYCPENSPPLKLEEILDHYFIYKESKKALIREIRKQAAKQKMTCPEILGPNSNAIGKCDHDLKNILKALSVPPEEQKVAFQFDEKLYFVNRNALPKDSMLYLAAIGGDYEGRRFPSVTKKQGNIVIMGVPDEVSSAFHSYLEHIFNALNSGQWIEFPRSLDQTQKSEFNNLIEYLGLEEKSNIRLKPFRSELNMMSRAVLYYWDENYEIQFIKRHSQSEAPRLPKNLGKVRDIATSSSVDCAISETGAIQCWNSFLGPPNWVESINRVPSGEFDSISMAWGGYSCAKKSNRTVVCWQAFATKIVPYPPEDLKNVLSVAVGRDDSKGQSACAVTREGDVKCWGGLTEKVPADLREIVSVTVKSDVACGVQKSGKVRCWGPKAQVFAVANLKDVVSLSFSWHHLYAVLANGTVQVVESSNPKDRQAERLPEDLRDVVALSLGDGTNFAVTSEGKIHLWGIVSYHESPLELRPPDFRVFFPKWMQYPSKKAIRH